MLFIIYCIDKNGSAKLRAKNRSAHINFLEQYRSNIFAAGPILADDCKEMTGSLLIVDFPCMEDANTFAINDPYSIAGLFESVSSKPWRRVFEPES